MTDASIAAGSSAINVGWDWRRVIGLSCVLAATFMCQVDGFVITVAAPVVQRDLPATFGQVQLAGAIYVVMMAAGLVTGAALGDRWGRKQVFLTGVAVFGLASAGCAAAATANQLIVARAVQGIAAAALVPQEIALLHGMYPEATRRAKALAGYGAVLGLGVVTGLVGGGWLTDLNIAGVSWRAAFLLIVPVSAAVVVIGSQTIPSSPRLTQGVDVPGMVLTAIAGVGMMVPLLLWWDVPHAAPLVGVAGLGLLAVVGLWWQQRRRAQRDLPQLLPPRVFRSPAMLTALAAVATFFAANAALFLVASYFLQVGLGLSPTAAGWFFAPLGIGFAVASAASAAATNWLGDRLPMWGCLALVGVFGLFLVLPVVPSAAQPVVVSLVLTGVGLAQGCVVAPLIGRIMGLVSTRDVGAASGVASMVTQAGLASGYVVGGLGYRAVLGGAPGVVAADPAQHVVAMVVCAVGFMALAGVTAWWVRPGVLVSSSD